MAGLEKKETEVENVRVMGRINPRPGDVCLKHENTTTVVPLEEDGTPHHHKYTFDHIFGTGEKQEGVFDMIGVPTIDKIMEGYNGTVFAYGQSGSGKTHTMLAPDGGSAKCLDPSRAEFSNRGLIPRMCAEIFQRIEKRRAEDKTVHYQVECSFYEIYNEELMDLLAEPLPTNLLPGERAKLQKRIRLEGSKDTFKIVGLVSREMKEPGDILALVQEGTARRHVASTKLNDTSSRSHSIIQIQLNQTDAILKNVTTSQLNLVDLAGCESLGRTGAQGLTMKEGMKINLSLTTLGIVINQLCRGEKHISFRDAMLTRVLQNSLGGNTLTTLIVTVSQLRINYSDTVSVLRFAERAKQIKNKARVNKQRSAGEWEMLYKQAQEEIASLQQRMQLKEVSEKKKEKDAQNDELIDDLRRQLERVMREKDEIAAVLAEKEKDLFASDQRLQALQKELDDTTAELGLIELDKNESQAMYESTTEAIKKIEAQVAHETRVKEELQTQVKTLRAEAEGMKEENKQLKEAERQREVDDVAKERELAARVAEVALLQRSVATREEEVKKLQQDKEYELSERASSEEALKQQIEALKAAGGGAAGGALAGDLQALMDQSEEALKSLKEENKRLRDEGHNLKLKVTEAESASAQDSQEVEALKKHVETLQAMQNKQKQNHRDQGEELTRSKSDATALRAENQALQERLASETATLENHLRTVELAKEKAEKEAQHIKDEHAGCRATIEQKDAEIRRLLARIAELESMYAQREEEAEQDREQLHKQGKELTTCYEQMKEKDDTIQYMVENIKKAIVLVEGTKLPAGEKEEIIKVLKLAMDPKSKDVIDKLAARLYDESAQHELICHVEILMEDRKSDVKEMCARLQSIMKEGGVVSDTLEANMRKVKNELLKVEEVLSIREFNNVADEELRKDLLSAAHSLGRLMNENVGEMDEYKSMNETSTDVICPMCQGLFPKTEINQHFATAHA